MHEIVNTFLLVFAATFPILDPVGAAMIFYAMTARASPVMRRRMAARIAIYSFLFLIASLYIGAYVLTFFGISLPVLRVAGGIVVAAAGWKMLNEETDAEEADRALPAGLSEEAYLRKAFYPLTMPLTTWPGTIAVLIALGTGRPTQMDAMGGWRFFLGALAAIVALSATVFICFAGAAMLRRLLGASGSEVVLRLMAFILICIGVQILWTGVEALVVSLPH